MENEYHMTLSTAVQQQTYLLMRSHICYPLTDEFLTMKECKKLQIRRRLNLEYDCQKGHKNIC